MRVGDIVWPCYDAKMARGVPGIVIKTRQNKGVLVRFIPWLDEDNEIVEVWFRRRANTNDYDWSKYGTNKTRLGGVRYFFCGRVGRDETEGWLGAYYLLRTKRQMTIHGYPLPFSTEAIEQQLKVLRA